MPLEGALAPMTTLRDRVSTALLVVDAQCGVLGATHGRAAVVDTLRQLVDRARAAGVAVVWVRHEDEQLARGSEAWRIVPELSPIEGEPVVDKRHADAFEDTTLERELGAAGIGHLVVVGGQTDMCVRSTLHGGFVRGYDVTLVADAHTTEDLTRFGAPPPAQVIVPTNLFWAQQTAPGRRALVVDAADLTFDAHARSPRATPPGQRA
jgi:hypothetical protein